MSAGYAARLKDYPDKGICGLPELSETTRSYKAKIEKLATMIIESNHTVILTGAGISTSAGIPDFRGPQGIWTLEQKRKPSRKRKLEKTTQVGSVTSGPIDVTATTEAVPSFDFESAEPTFTHHAITRLVSNEIVHFVVTQNVDGLHRRSGLSRENHSVLHGCAFTELCEDCMTEHFRDKDVGGMSFEVTGRNCDACGGALRDTLLDWEDPLPVEDLHRSETECEASDLVLCLGTSLRIDPVNKLPQKAKRFVVVNLQRTPSDAEAALVIRERVDRVMRDIVERLIPTTWDVSSTANLPIERLWQIKRSEE